MSIEKDIFRRTELLLGDDTMSRIAEKRVIIFGVGGVGSWCAESLVRSGIRKLTIVDSDRVCVTNINRQLMATTKTIGQVKVDALKERLLSINPSAAALKLDPTRIKIAEFWKVQGDPLARALRNRFKRDKQFPKRKFQCVYSDELLQNQKPIDPDDRGNGTIAHITAIFGFTLAGLVVQDIVASYSE